MNGKTYGMIAFIVTEVLVIIGIIGLVASAFNKIDMNVSLGAIMTLQGAVFATTWGSVATKNFRKEL